MTTYKKMECALGTVCALSYTDLFMTQLKEDHIDPYIKDMPLLYLRYIDDIFTI